VDRSPAQGDHVAAVPLSASLPDSSSGGSTIKNDDLSMKKGDLTKKKRGIL